MLSVESVQCDVVGAGALMPVRDQRHGVWITGQHSVPVLANDANVCASTTSLLPVAASKAPRWRLDTIKPDSRHATRLLRVNQHRLNGLSNYPDSAFLLPKRDPVSAFSERSLIGGAAALPWGSAWGRFVVRIWRHDAPRIRPS
jgi:hypothetical protein